MSDKPIEKMTFDELRNEVRLLSDSLAKMKRFYKDAFYNLDNDNFSKTIIKEKNGMKAQIKLNEKEISTKVSTDAMESAIVQSAGSILLTVGASYETKADAETKLTTARTEIQQSANSIISTVSETYETKSDAVSSYSVLSSSISQTAQRIQSIVSKQADIKNAVEVASIAAMSDTTKIYVIRSYYGNNSLNAAESETYYYYDTDTNTWKALTGNSIYSLFTQTATGFSLKGNVIMDGGQISWSNANNPVKALYARNDAGRPNQSYALYPQSSSSGWHTDIDEANDKYASYTYDNGATWTLAIKIKGENGANGTNGTNGTNGVVDYSTLATLLDNNYGITKTSLNGAYIESPEIYGGVFYSAANGKVATMSNNGFEIFTSRNANSSAMIGCFNSDSTWAYPFVRLGIGSGQAYDAGMIAKLGDSLWIGNNALGWNSTLGLILDTQNATPMGLRIYFSGSNAGKTYRYDGGSTGVDISTATAVFG